MPLSIPKFIKTAFAQFGVKNSIPETTNNITGAAGYNQGFSEINMLPEGGGGIPPDGKDFNGILYDITSSLQYLQSGLVFPYDQDFASSIGGYAKGSRVASASDTSVIYYSLVDANLTPPPGANWATGATETFTGPTRYATQSEVNAGVSANTSVSPEKMLFGFSVSLSSTRSQITFPRWMGGVIFQWGSTTTNAAGVGTVTFLKAFPNQCSAFVPSVNGNTTPNLEAVQFANLTKNGANIFAGDVTTGGPLAANVMWIAIGY